MTAEAETISDAKVTFICDCEEGYHSACQGEVFFREYEGKSYCVLHYPDKDKIEAFRIALNRKLAVEDFDFGGVWFPEKADFRGVQFTAEAYFHSAIFSSEADFLHATFSTRAYFSYAKFSEKAYFISAIFSEKAYFVSAIFSETAYFPWATFSAEADFDKATFSTRAVFSFAIFKSYTRFSSSPDTRMFGNTSRLELEFAHIERPERISFHSLYLHPHWFINVDCRKFEFIAIEWNVNIEEQIEGSRKAGIAAAHKFLAITFRQLADNAEANRLYHEASRFRYNSFESQRIERFRGFVPWRLDFWYWLASGYGERVGKAFLVFVALIALFAFGYSKVGFKPEIEAATGQPAISQQKDVIGKPLEWKEALVYSANVSILQKPDPKPLTFAAQSLVWAETILGPAQAALLALAIRRRFMR